MGSFFESENQITSATTVSPEQQALFGPLRDAFLRLIDRDPFDIQGAEDIFANNFLGPALQAFNRTGGTRDQIQQGFARQGGLLSTRREATVGDALGNVQAGAGQAFAGILPTLISLQLQPFQMASSFALSSTMQNFALAQPSMFDNLSGVLGMAGSLASGFSSAGG